MLPLLPKNSLPENLHHVITGAVNIVRAFCANLPDCALPPTQFFFNGILTHFYLQCQTYSEVIYKLIIKDGKRYFSLLALILIFFLKF